MRRLLLAPVPATEGTGALQQNHKVFLCCWFPGANQRRLHETTLSGDDLPVETNHVTTQNANPNCGHCSSCPWLTFDLEMTQRKRGIVSTCTRCRKKTKKLFLHEGTCRKRPRQPSEPGACHIRLNTKITSFSSRCWLCPHLPCHRQLALQNLHLCLMWSFTSSVNVCNSISQPRLSGPGKRRFTNWHSNWQIHSLSVVHAPMQNHLCSASGVFADWSRTCVS